MAEGMDRKRGRKSRMDVGEVRSLLKDGYGVEDIQKHYGYKTKATVVRFLERNRINTRIYTDGHVRQPDGDDEGTILALYTSGKFSLRETAAELGTSKKLLYEYLQEHPKLIPTRKGAGSGDGKCRGDKTRGEQGRW